jgi:hypothetical protein
MLRLCLRLQRKERDMASRVWSADQQQWEQSQMEVQAFKPLAPSYTDTPSAPKVEPAEIYTRSGRTPPNTKLYDIAGLVLVVAMTLAPLALAPAYGPYVPPGTAQDVNQATTGERNPGPPS